MIHIDRITKDEPLNGTGNGNTDVDAILNIDDVLLLQAERERDGDGRVYSIEFTAINVAGLECPIVVSIVEPHSKRGEVIDTEQTEGGELAWDNCGPPHGSGTGVPSFIAPPGAATARRPGPSQSKSTSWVIVH